MSTITHDIDLSDYPHLDKGLEGIVAFSSKKSFIDGTKGELIYSGYNINDLAQKSTFEEVCFLLWHERLPSQAELDELNEVLRAERDIPKEVIDYIESAPKDAIPMAVLRTAVSMLADHDEETEDYSDEAILRKSIRMTAKIPAIIAGFSRKREGKSILSPLKKNSIAYDFLYMLNGEEPGEKTEQTLDMCLILHAEHGMNASTFTCRSICATKSDIHSAVTGAIGSLKGPLHGGANTAVMNMLKSLDRDTDIASFVRDKLAQKEKISGFGHRVYKTFDPRAYHLRDMAEGLAKEVDMEYLYDWSETILKVMKEEKNIDPNVDFFSATVYYSMGIEPDLYTCIFAMARISGWTAHYIEQWNNNRLIRPRQLYLAGKNLPYTNIEDR